MDALLIPVMVRPTLAGEPHQPTLQFAGLPGLRLRDGKVHLADERAYRSAAGAGLLREAAVLQSISIAGLSPASSSARKPPHT
jgi:hypothetical protein